MTVDGPNWPQCTNMMSMLRNDVFEKMDAQHQDTMNGFTEVKAAIAGMKGEARGADKARSESTKHSPIKALNLTTREIVMILAAIGSLITAVIFAMNAGSAP